MQRAAPGPEFRARLAQRRDRDVRRALVRMGGALLLLAATTAGNAFAQSVPTLEIISAEHDPRGLITASVASSKEPRTTSSAMRRRTPSE